MRIKIKRFDKSIPLPVYKSVGATCVDLYSRVDTTIAPHQIGYIPLNIAADIPDDCWLMIASRGSTHKLGILMVNGIAIGDSDFRGDQDEYSYPALNFTDKEVKIEKGTRLAQMMVMRYEPMEIEEVDQLNHPDRGKYGSTGIK